MAANTELQPHISQLILLLTIKQASVCQLGDIFNSSCPNWGEALSCFHVTNSPNKHVSVSTAPRSHCVPLSQILLCCKLISELETQNENWMQKPQHLCSGQQQLEWVCHCNQLLAANISLGNTDYNHTLTGRGPLRLVAEDTVCLDPWQQQQQSDNQQKHRKSPALVLKEHKTARRNKYVQFRSSYEAIGTTALKLSEVHFTTPLTAALLRSPPP